MLGGFICRREVEAHDRRALCYCERFQDEMRVEGCGQKLGEDHGVRVASRLNFDLR